MPWYMVADGPFNDSFVQVVDMHHVSNTIDIHLICL